MKRKNKKGNNFAYKIGDIVIVKDTYIDTEYGSRDEPYEAEIISMKPTRYGNLVIIKEDGYDDRALREDQIICTKEIKGRG